MRRAGLDKLVCCKEHNMQFYIDLVQGKTTFILDSLRLLKISPGTNVIKLFLFGGESRIPYTLISWYIDSNFKALLNS